MDSEHYFAPHISILDPLRDHASSFGYYVKHIMLQHSQLLLLQQHNKHIVLQQTTTIQLLHNNLYSSVAAEELIISVAT